MESLARQTINTQLNSNAMSNKQEAMSLKERQQALRDRRQKMGLVRVEVWVPKACAQMVKTYAKRVAKGATEG